MAFQIKQYDRRPLFVVVLKDNFGEEDEAIVNLTTASTAVFNMRPEGSSVARITRGAALISNAAGGEVTYSWGTSSGTVGDTAVPGTYEAEIEITWNDGKPETFPNDGYWEVEITDDIA